MFCVLGDGPGPPMIIHTLCAVGGPRVSRLRAGSSAPGTEGSVAAASLARVVPHGPGPRVGCVRQLRVHGGWSLRMELGCSLV